MALKTKNNCMCGLKHKEQLWPVMQETENHFLRIALTY